MRTYPTRGDLYADLMPPEQPALEIGLWCGGNAVEILKRGSPSILHLVEPWCDRDVNNSHKPHQGRMKHAVGRLVNQIAAGRVVIHIGFSTEVVPIFPWGYFGFTYIDGSHDLVSVTADLRLCAKVVSDDGVIAGHDLQRSEVERAVKQFCCDTGWQVIATTNQDDSQSFALKRT